MRTFRAPIAIVLSTLLTLPATVVAAAPPPASPTPTKGDPASMSDEQRMEIAKGLYAEGDAALNGGDAVTALTKFEEAYNVYAPGVHVFNFNIGLAAQETGDCAKAKTAFQRFLDLVPNHAARGEAQEKLLEIERSGCANAVPEPTDTGTGAVTSTGPVAADNEDAPELLSKRSAREDAIEEEIEEKESKKASPLLVSGAVLTAVGGLALIGGAVSIALANKKANDLAGLASPGPTGFPDGNYSDDEVFKLDRNELPANNAATIGLFVSGGVLATVGITLLVLHARKKKKGKKPADKNARQAPEQPRLVNVGGAYLPGGAGAAATVRF